MSLYGQGFVFGRTLPALSRPSSVEYGPGRPPAR